MDPQLTVLVANLTWLIAWLWRETRWQSERSRYVEMVHAESHDAYLKGKALDAQPAIAKEQRKAAEASAKAESVSSRPPALRTMARRQMAAQERPI